MILDTLSIINFKNIADEQLKLSEQVNCFVGDNGAGKTNILDAVHYLALARSMHTITDAQSVRHSEDELTTKRLAKCRSKACRYCRRIATAQLLKWSLKIFPNCRPNRIWQSGSSAEIITLEIQKNIINDEKLFVGDVFL